MQDLEHNNDNTSINLDEDLHALANKTFLEAHQLVFQTLPVIMKKLIDQGDWQEKHENFGEYALHPSSDGLNITNNHKLWILKCAMDIHGRHALEWGDVLAAADNSARSYAKENKVQIKDLHKSLDRAEQDLPREEEAITYLPSRSKSNDSQLMRLRKNDENTYNKVMKGEMTLKEACPPAPRKQVEPIESVKNKFKNLSNADRVAFLAWLEEQAITG